MIKLLTKTFNLELERLEVINFYISFNNVNVMINSVTYDPIKNSFKIRIGMDTAEDTSLDGALKKISAKIYLQYEKEPTKTD